MENLYIFWLIVALVLIIVEMLTAGFAVICFAIGALITSIVAYAGLGINWQLTTMAIVTLLAFVLVRPFILKFLSKKRKNVLMNADAIVGSVGRVSEKIDSNVGTGRVAINGDDWKAISNDGSIIEKGANVKVISRNSLIITVEIIK